MYNLGTLYRYELKKIVMKKMVWITMGILVGITLFMCAGVPLMTTNTVIEGENRKVLSGAQYIDYEKEIAGNITGQKIDDTMLNKAKAAYRRVHVEDATEEGKNSVTTMYIDENSEEQGGDARRQYQDIYKYVQNITGDFEAIHTIDAEELYRTRLENLERVWTNQKLTEGEKSYWLKEEQKTEKPFTYGYMTGWEILLDTFQTLNFMLIVASSLSLSGVFSEEHMRKTDQLIFCSKYGKKTLFFAKMAAGVTFSVVSGAVLLLVAIGAALLTYGTEGMEVTTQIWMPICARNLTMGEAVLVLSGAYLAGAVLNSIVVLYLSETVKNSVAVMGMVNGFAIVSMFFTIPFRFRAVSQIYELLPSVLVNAQHLFDYRLVNVCGVYLNNFQAAVALYGIVGAVCILWGNRIYKRL